MQKKILIIICIFFTLFIFLRILGILKFPLGFNNKLSPPSTVLAANKENKFKIYYTSSGDKKIFTQRFQIVRPGFLKKVFLSFYGKGLVEIRTGENEPDANKESLLASGEISNFKKGWAAVKFDKRPFLISGQKYWIEIVENTSLGKKHEYDQKDMPVPFELYTERDLNAISLNHGATINFFPVNGADYYNIYRSDDLGRSWGKVGSTSELGYTDINLVNGRKYLYSVTACSFFSESVKSKPVSVIPDKDRIPSLHWKQPLYSNGFGEFPLFYKGDKFIGAGTNVYRFNIKTGKLKKIYKIVDDNISLTKNFIVPGQGLIVKIKKQKCLIWGASCNYSTVGRINFPLSVVTAMRLSDGKKIWTKFVKGRYIAEGLVADKEKFFMTTVDNGLFAFDIQTGRTKFVSHIYSSNVPVIYGNYLYFGESRRHYRTKWFYRINKNTGTFNRLYLSENINAGFSSPIVINDPFISKKILFCSRNGEVFLIDINGFRKKWTFVSHYGISNDSLFGAGAYHDGRFYVSISNSIFALDIRKNPGDKGFIIWEKKIKNESGGPTYVSGAVTLTNNALYGRGARYSPNYELKEIVAFALDPKNGNDRWIMTFQGKSGFICSNPWPYEGLLSLDRAYSPDMSDPGYADYVLKVSKNTKRIDLLDYRGGKYHQGYVDLDM